MKKFSLVIIVVAATVHMMALVGPYVSLAYAETPQAVDVPEWILNKDKLKKENWRNTSGYSIIAGDWPAYEGEQGLTGKVILKRTELKIMGIQFRVEQHEYQNDGTKELVTYNLEHFPENFCKALFKKVSESLGKPDEVVETAKPVYNSTLADWKIGDSIVRFQCSGGNPFGSGYVSSTASFQIGHKAKVKPVEAVSYIQCEGKSENLSLTALNGLSEIEAVPPFTLSIDPNRQELCLLGSRCYKKQVQFSEIQLESEDVGTVNAGKSDEALKTESILIDRQNGTYIRSRVFKTKYNGVIRFKENGVCHKTNGSPKF